MGALSWDFLHKARANSERSANFMISHFHRQCAFFLSFVEKHFFFIVCSKNAEKKLVSSYSALVI